jgi:magnesium-protoporphyrin O-methyltransferase
MLAPEHGEFDAVISMDALIHYNAEAAANAIAGLARRTSRKMVFTLAPRTKPLVVMQAAGKLFPRGDRSPAIQPVAIERLIATTLSRADMAGWQSAPPTRISTGFYISEAQELARS